MSAVGLLVGAVRDLHAINLNAVAVTALMAYEIMITLGQEVRYIWRSRWSMVKALYLIIRYYSMLFLLTNSFVITNAFLSQKVEHCGSYSCHHYKSVLIWGNFVIWPLVDCLIVVRIYALYGQSKKMAFVLAALWLAETIIAFTLLGFTWAPFEAIANPLPGILTGCLANFDMNFPTYALSLAFWSITCGFQAIYVGLTLFKLYGIVRIHGISRSTMTPLLTVFFRDGAAYFLIILASILTNIFIERFGSVLLSEAGSLWSMVIPSIATCRLVLNIRGVNAPTKVTLVGQREDVPSGSTELNDMKFQSHGDTTLV